MTLTYFTARSDLVAYAFELIQKSFHWNNLSQMTKLMEDFEKLDSMALSTPAPYMTTIFKNLFSLKRLDQSKPNFMWSLLGKGERGFI